jgi:AraC-like DNA-binding protein
MQIRKHPCSLFTPEETAHIETCFNELLKKMQQRTHAFHREVMYNATEAFFLELGNILIGKKETHVRSTLSRKEELMNQFLQLLFEHAKEQHAVTFYADKLFITPQYLTLILKELTGKSANKWIEDALFVEAKVLLKAPQTTVQQVADKLNFSDQSTFGKFFKKHLGISPMEYRKS